MKKKTKRNLIIGGSIASILLGIIGWRMYRSRDYSIRMTLSDGKNPTLKVPSGKELMYDSFKGKEIGKKFKDVNFVVVGENPNKQQCNGPFKFNYIDVPKGNNPKILHDTATFMVDKGETVNLWYFAEQSFGKRLRTGAKYVMCDIEVKGI